MVHRVLLVSGLLVVGVRFASAGEPAWCKGEDFKASHYNVNSAFQDADVRGVIRSIVEYECSTDPELDASRPMLEKHRADVSKQAFMTDDDWSDAVQYIKEQGFSGFDIPITEKTLTSLTPIDQFRAIESGMDVADRLYVTDALDNVLTETGRLAFIEECVKDTSVTRDDDSVAMTAICQADIDKFDGKKFSNELRTDTAHPAKARTALHVIAYNTMDAIKTNAELMKKLVKRDDAYKKVFDTAAKGRADWQKTLGGQKDLLDLVSALDSATMFHSRKQFAGCEDKTGKALADAITSVPAKAFTGMHDIRDNPFEGFGVKSGPVLVNNPSVNLAATAYSLCRAKSPTARYLSRFLQEVPGMRGPRSAAFGAIFVQKFELDDTKLGSVPMPKIGSRPYNSSGGEISTAGGVVKSIKPGTGADKGKMIVTLETTKIKQEDCVKEHQTNRIVGILDSGTLQYERICDKTAIVEHDNTWEPFRITPETAKWLKPGIVFSAVTDNDAGEVIAVWPTKTAKLPSQVVGGAVK